MFFVLALLSMFGYALQIALMASYYRRIDPFTATCLRGISLGISMLPLLFFSEASAIAGIVDYPLEILGAALFAAFGNWAAANAVRCLPVGIANALQQGMLVLFITCIGVLVFQEELLFVEYICILFVLVGNLFLGLNAGERSVSSKRHLLYGFLFCTLFGVLLSVAFTLMTAVSRALDPLVAGYFWEFLIGVVSLVIIFCRSQMFGKSMEEVSIKDFLKILLFSSPTAIGTGCYAVAVTKGPIAIVMAIVSTMIVVTTILAYFLYREKPSLRQWCAIFVILSAIIGIKLSEPSSRGQALNHEVKKRGVLATKNARACGFAATSRHNSRHRPAEMVIHKSQG